MKKILSILFFIANLITFAQGGWQKKILVPGSSASSARNVVECPNGDFIAVGITIDKVNNINVQRLTLVGMNPHGIELWQKSYGIKQLFYGDTYTGGAIVKDNGGFYHALVVDSNNRGFAALLKFDYNGDTLWQKIYRTAYPGSIRPEGICKTVDGGFLITGYYSDTGATECLLIKTDKNGNELWQKRINKPTPNYQHGLCVVQDSLTKKIVIVGLQITNQNVTESNVLILDSLGKKLIQKNYNSYDGGPFNGLIQLSDKNFLTCGALNSGEQLQLGKYYQMAVKFDINGNVIWSKTYDVKAAHTDLSFLYELPNGDLIMAGRIDTLTYSTGTVTRQQIKIYKTDKDGNLKWGRYVGDATGYGEWPRSMNATSDGGFILTAGQVLEHINTPYNLIKIDANGCDTLEAWCKSVEVGFDGLNPDSYRGKDYILKIYPNPTTKILNVEFDPDSYRDLNEDSELSITDIYGKEVKRTKATNQNQINVADLKAGIYFLQVYENGKLLGTQKIMKE